MLTYDDLYLGQYLQNDGCHFWVIAKYFGDVVLFPQRELTRAIGLTNPVLLKKDEVSNFLNQCKTDINQDKKE